MSRSNESSGEIRKRTPLEQAIAEQTNRRARYEAKREREGFIRTTFYVPKDRLAEVKAFIQKLNAVPQGSAND